MARKATLTNTATKGCLDPDLSERIDLKHYYDSVAAAENQEGAPQGGWHRRAGTATNSDPDVLAQGLKRRLRRRIQPINVTSGMITLHNGGTAANLIDQDRATLFTTTAVSGTNFVIVEFDLGASMPVCFVDVIGYFCETAAKDDAIAVEYYDGAQWVEVRGAIDAGASTRRHIRTRGYKDPVAVQLASTQEFERKDTPIVDGVQTVVDDLVLVKDDDTRSKNGVYKVAAGEWARATIADAKSEISRASYFVQGGLVNAGAVWVNQQSLSDLNNFGSIDKSPPITYAFAPDAGRTRRFGEWPGGPGGQMVSARNWRIVAKNAAGAGTISISGIRFWQERRAISPASGFAFDRGADNIYDLILTERNIDVFKRGQSGSRRYVASIPVPVAAHQIDEMTAVQSRDTMLLFHEDVPTIRIVRQGRDSEWNVDTIPAFNVPALPAGTAFSGDQDEVQDVSFDGIADGERFVVWVGDLVTSPVTMPAGGTGLEALLAAAIDTLPGVAAPTVSLVSASTMRIAFTGVNGSRAWPAVQIMPLDDSQGTPRHVIEQPGLVAGGPWFGALTGWPRCGFFVQGRVLVAGFRSAPYSWGVSSINSWDFRDDPTLGIDDISSAPPLTADMAFFRTLNTDQVETIQQVFVGRNLQFFTDSSEWYVESRTFDATQPANAIRATGSGIKSSVRAVFSEGSTIIVQQGGRTVRDFLFNDVEQSYKAEPLSLLGPHLLTDVVDVAQRKAKTTQEANRIYFVNDDGSLVTLSLLRAQDVIGMWPATTDGLFKGVVGHFNGDIGFIVQRTSASGDDLYFEQRDDTTPLDCATTVTADAPFMTVSGLHHLEGKSVWAYAGKQLCGPFVVTDGSISVDGADAATTITVGLYPPLYGRMQKLREKLQVDLPFRPPARIYEAGLSLKNTGQLQIRANGGEWREVPLTYMDGGTLDYGELDIDGGEYTPDLPMLERLLTGDVTLQNLRGWTKHGIFEWRQTVPAPLHIKAVRLEVAMK